VSQGQELLPSCCTCLCGTTQRLQWSGFLTSVGPGSCCTAGKVHNGIWTSTYPYATDVFAQSPIQPCDLTNTPVGPYSPDAPAVFLEQGCNPSTSGETMLMRFDYKLRRPSCNGVWSVEVSPRVERFVQSWPGGGFIYDSFFMFYVAPTGQCSFPNPLQMDYVGVYKVRSFRGSFNPNNPPPYDQLGIQLDANGNPVSPFDGGCWTYDAGFSGRFSYTFTGLNPGVVMLGV